jgi:3-hydroxyacyl-[acyl-carrier-protein] dehydratase
MPIGGRSGGLMSRLEFSVCVAASHPALPGHFPRQAIVPGVLLVDQVLAKIFELSGWEATGLPYVKFSSALKPDERADVLFEAGDGHAVFRVSMNRDDKNVVLASGKILMQRPGDEALD